MVNGASGEIDELAGQLGIIYSLLLLEEDESIRASYWNSADVAQEKIAKKVGKQEAARIAKQAFELSQKEAAN